MTRLIGDSINAADINGIYQRASASSTHPLYVGGAAYGMFSAGGYAYWYKRNTGASSSYLTRRPTGLVAPTYYAYPHASVSPYYPDPDNIAIADGGSSAAPVLYSKHYNHDVYTSSASFNLVKFQTSGATVHEVDPVTTSTNWATHFTLPAKPTGWVTIQWHVFDGVYWLGTGNYYYGIELLQIVYFPSGDGSESDPWAMVDLYSTPYTYGASYPKKIVLTKRNLSDDAIVSVTTIRDLSISPDISYVPTSLIIYGLAADSTYVAAGIDVGVDECDELRFLIANYPACTISHNEVLADTYDDGIAWVGVDAGNDTAYMLKYQTMQHSDLSDWSGDKHETADFGTSLDVFATPVCGVGDQVFAQGSTGYGVYGYASSVWAYSGLWRGGANYTQPITAGATILASDMTACRTMLSDRASAQFVTSSHAPVNMFTSGLYANASRSILSTVYGETMAATPTNWHDGAVSAGDIVKGFHFGDTYAVADYIATLIGAP